MQGILLLLASVMVVTGATLVIFGATYTVASCNLDGDIVAAPPSGYVFSGYPLWNPPVRNTFLACGNVIGPSGPSIVNYTANYTLNYTGIAILLIAMVAIFALLRWNPRTAAIVKITA